MPISASSVSQGDITGHRAAEGGDLNGSETVTPRRSLITQYTVSPSGNLLGCHCQGNYNQTAGIEFVSMFYLPDKRNRQLGPLCDPEHRMRVRISTYIALKNHPIRTVSEQSSRHGLARHQRPDCTPERSCTVWGSAVLTSLIRSYQDPNSREGFGCRRNGHRPASPARRTNS